MGKKKANGEGSITKRKDGRYMGRYTVESKRKAVYQKTTLSQHQISESPNNAGR